MVDAMMSACFQNKASGKAAFALGGFGQDLQLKVMDGEIVQRVEVCASRFKMSRMSLRQS